MSFVIEEVSYPVLDWEGRTTEEGPKVSVKQMVVARWDMQGGHLPTIGDIMDAVSDMKSKYPGREDTFRIVGLPKPGDRIFGVEVA